MFRHGKEIADKLREARQKILGITGIEKGKTTTTQQEEQINPKAETQEEGKLQDPSELSEEEHVSDEYRNQMSPTDEGESQTTVQSDELDKTKIEETEKPQDKEPKIESHWYNFNLDKNIVNKILELSPNDETTFVLKEILYKGKYKSLKLDTGLANRGNSMIDEARRYSMAKLLLKNPDVFYYIAENGIDLYHGTNSNALPSILKYGLYSEAESLKNGIYVETGEEWSRIADNPRAFVSFSDIFNVAEDYSRIRPKNQNGMSFPIIIGIKSDSSKKYLKTHSAVVEVGIWDKISLENISTLIVPKDKVLIVKSMCDNKDIQVLGLGDNNLLELDSAIYHLQAW